MSLSTFTSLAHQKIIDQIKTTFIKKLISVHITAPSTVPFQTEEASYFAEDLIPTYDFNPDVVLEYKAVRVV